MSAPEDTKISAEAWKDLAAYVRSTLPPDSAVPIGETTALISSGLLDSYSVVELIAHVEERFGIEVSPRWYRLEHLDSLERILQTVERIQRGAT
jgi:acyl carrier protein